MNKLFAFILPGAMLLMASCAKEGPTGPAGPTGPSGPAYTGAISGHVSLFDQYGSKVLTGLSAVRLTLKGGAVANADTSGYYLFSGLQTGSYNIQAVATGYATTQANNFQFLSDTLNRDIKLSAIPSFAPTAFAAYETAGMTGDSLVLSFDADPRPRTCIVFLNSTATVNNLPANYLLYYSKAIAANQTKAVINIPSQDLYDAGIGSGNTAYYAAYGYVVSDASAYEDLNTGKAVINAVSSTSLAANAIVP